MRFGTLILVGLAFVIGISLGGANSDDAAPAPRVVTETVEVEVAGPTVYTVSDECRDFIAAVDDANTAVYDYERGIAPQQQILRDALRAIVLGDVQLVNQNITAQNTVNNETTGPLQTIVEYVNNNPDLRAACRATLED